MYDIQQSTSGTDIVFLMVLTSDHISPATGLSPTVTLRKNQSSFASPAGTVSEIAKGWYKISGTGLTSDTNTLGPLILNASGAAADFTDQLYNVVAYNPQDATRLGLTQIPSTGTIPTVGTGTNQISVTNGQVILQTGTGTGQLDFTNGIVKSNITQVTGVNVSASLAQFGVNVVNINGSISQGAAGYIGIDWSKINSPTSTVVLSNTSLNAVGTTSGLSNSSISSNTFNVGTITGVATGFLEEQRQVWRRFFKKVEKDGSTIKTYADNGSTVITTQTYVSSSTETVNAAS